MKTNKLATLAVGATLVLLFTGCASGAPTTDPGPPPSQVASGDSSGPAITITNFAFEGPTSVASGATVTVTNTDAAAHTVTSDDDSSFSVTVEGNGGTATFAAPITAGSYSYHCKFHASMKGILVVT